MEPSTTSLAAARPRRYPLTTTLGSHHEAATHAHSHSSDSPGSLASRSPGGAAACSGGAGSDSATGAQDGVQPLNRSRKPAKSHHRHLLRQGPPSAYRRAAASPADTTCWRPYRADLGVTAVRPRRRRPYRVLEQGRHPPRELRHPERAEKVGLRLPLLQGLPSASSPLPRLRSPTSPSCRRDPHRHQGTTAEAYFEANHREVKLQKYDQYRRLPGPRGRPRRRLLHRHRGHRLGHRAPRLRVGIKSWRDQLCRRRQEGQRTLLDWLNNR